MKRFYTMLMPALVILALLSSGCFRETVYVVSPSGEVKASYVDPDKYLGPGGSHYRSEGVGEKGFHGPEAFYYPQSMSESEARAYVNIHKQAQQQEEEDEKNDPFAGGGGGGGH